MKLFSSIFKLTILVLATVSISRIAFAADPAGVILKVSGETRISAASGELREAVKKGRVYVGDTLKTGLKAQAFVMMNDKTRMIVRENSEVLIEAFVYEKRDTDKQSTTLLKGALRSISG